MTKKNINNLCIVGNVYGLYLYLFSHTQIEIDNTLFITKKNLIKNESYLKNVIHIHDSKLYQIPIFRYVIFRFIFRLFIFGLKKYDKIYAQDHLLYANLILWNKEYTLIEDGPHSINLYSQTNLFKDNLAFLKRPKWEKKWQYFWKGYAYHLPHGLSEKATSILAYADDEIYQNLHKKVYAINNIHKQISREKKEFLINVFSLDEYKYVNWKEKEIILFTQPLCVDKLCSKKEHQRIYSNIINKYPKDQLIIKVHPRDTFMYENISPGITIIRGAIPSQLFDIFGIHFQRAVTVFSTSVLSISYPIKIDWWGTQISDELYSKLGDIQPPINKNRKGYDQYHSKN